MKTSKLMKKSCRRWFPVLATAALGTAPLATTQASEEMFQNAVVEDRLMGDIHGRLDTIRERQQESNVFSESEVRDTKEMGSSVGQVRDNEVKKIVVELGESAKSKDDESRRQHYEVARTEYATAVNSLGKLGKKAAQSQRSVNRLKRYNEQKELLEKTKKLEEGLNNGEKTPEQAADESLKLAREQTALAKEQKADAKADAETNQGEKSDETAAPEEADAKKDGKDDATAPDNAKDGAKDDANAPKDNPESAAANNPEVEDPAAKKMEQAANKLGNMDLPQAQEKMKAALDDMEKGLADTDPDSQDAMATSPELQAMTKLDEELKKMEESLGKSQSGEKPLNNDERQDMAGKMDDAAKKLAEQGLPEAEKNIDKAMEDTIANQDKDAQKGVQSARSNLEKAMNEEREKLANSQPQDPANSPELQAMNDLAKDLAGMEKALADSQSGEKPLGSEERKDLAGKMDNAAKKLGEQGLGEAAKDMDKAMDNAVANQDKDAAQAVKDAQAKLGKAIGEKREQLAKNQPPSSPSEPSEPSDQQSPPSEPSVASDSKENPPGEGQDLAAKKGKGREGDDWKAKLPERERGALLAARQAKYPELLGEEVKNYFVEIAK